MRCSIQPAAFGVLCRAVAMRAVISVTSCLSLRSDKMDILWFDPDVYLGVRHELFIASQVKIGSANCLPGFVSVPQEGAVTQLLNTVRKAYLKRG